MGYKGRGEVMSYLTTLHYHESMVLEAIYDLGRADISLKAVHLAKLALDRHQRQVKRIRKEIKELT